jgi:hypothetical protein
MAHGSRGCESVPRQLTSAGGNLEGSLMSRRHARHERRLDMRDIREAGLN